ncbi:MAG: MBOAT family protein [Lachnospiraceae bacterium]|nr:MBOAT family protein [Lachnospiraceae bacterium]
MGSLLFYILGSPAGLPYLLVVLLTGYFGGLLLNALNEKKLLCRILFFSFVFLCIALLFFFKYFEPDSLPVGISFFTFQAVGYLADIYLNRQKTEKNPVTFFTFIIFFPQLIAGPIVRFQDISAELISRKATLDDITDGLKRFLLGLFKKVLVADQLSGAISSWGMPSTVALHWMVAIAYTLQIYYDFSAYSDMAIGMGRLFGFHLPENFNYPYISKSITEFWRRWHMTLGSWFRDYVYIPLGGSRRGIKRTCFNLLVVFALTGLWHGIGWQFLSWGLFYGILLVLEKSFLLKWMERCPAWIRRCYTMLMVILGFVIFRSSSLSGAWNFLQGMSGVLYLPLWDRNTAFYFRDLLFPLCLFIPFCTPILPTLRELSSKNQKIAKAGAIISIAAYPLVFLLCSAWIITETPQPFLYFQF